MPYTEKQIKKIFNTLLQWTVVISLCSFLLAEPLKLLLFPILKIYAVGHTEFLLKLLFYIFFFCSLALMGLVYWLFRESIKMLRPKGKYTSMLIASDYYKENKKLDLEHFLMGDVSRLPASKLGADSEIGVQRRHLDDEKLQEIPVRQEIVRDGVTYAYYPDGKIKSMANYKNGKLDGALYTFYEDGRPHHEKHYRDGKLNGIFVAYDEQGVPYFEINYKNDKQDGLDKTYYKHGVVEYEDTYREGILMRRRTFDDGGSLLFEQNFTIDTKGV